MSRLVTPRDVGLTDGAYQILRALEEGRLQRHPEYPELRAYVLHEGDEECTIPEETLEGLEAQAHLTRAELPAATLWFIRLETRDKLRKVGTPRAMWTIDPFPLPYILVPVAVAGVVMLIVAIVARWLFGVG